MHNREENTLSSKPSEMAIRGLNQAAAPFLLGSVRGHELLL